MQWKTIKQIIICSVIVIACGAIAFFLKGYYFDNNNELSYDTTIKDKYEYNEFKLVDVTNETLIQRYFVDFKEKMLNDTEEAYKLLDKDAKETYKTYSEFKIYIENNYDNLKSSYIVKYKVLKNDDQFNYIVIDQFNNKYEFMAKAVLVYTVNFGLYDENSSIFE